MSKRETLERENELLNAALKATNKPFVVNLVREDIERKEQQRKTHNFIKALICAIIMVTLIASLGWAWGFVSTIIALGILFK